MTPLRSSRRLRWWLVALLGLFAAGCGSDPVTGAEPEATSAEAAPSTTANEPDIDRPQRIVSLSPTATEMLFAVGAGEQVVAVDEYSTYPPEAPVTDLSGFDPNVEAVLAYEPDLVVVAFDANDIVASLRAAGVEVLESYAPVTIEGGYQVLSDLGDAVGRPEETSALIEVMRTEIDAALALAPSGSVRVYHELDENYFSASSFGFIGDVYTALGAVNIADDVDSDGYGFPQLTEEYIVTADPELIVITDQVSYGPDEVAARAGWGEISAVVNGQVIVVNADSASRWGPRLPFFIAEVATAMAEVAS